MSSIAPIKKQPKSNAWKIKPAAVEGLPDDFHKMSFCGKKTVFGSKKALEFIFGSKEGILGNFGLKI